MALEVEITKSYPGFQLEVQLYSEHNRMGILGASGCGKSMTLKCIAGILKPDTGRIALDGQVFFDSEKKINLPPQKRKVGYLFQNYALFPTMTVEENLSCVLTGDKKRVRRKVRQQMEKYHLEGLGGQLPSQLSGGQQQRVALARMLLTDPQMILLDEPFSALDGFLKDVLQEEVMELLKDFPGEVLMVTHSRDEVYKMCDRLTILDQGRSLISGETKEIFRDPIYMETARLTGCKNISPVKILDEHHIHALDWNMTFQIDAEVAPGTGYIGIRAHYLQPVETKEQVNCFALKVDKYVEAPFEHQYLLRHEGAEKTIWWLVSKTEQAKPGGSMYFPQEALMLLK